MTQFQSFHCSECGEQVQLMGGKNRTCEYLRGVPKFPIPDDFLIPTCANCGEVYLGPDELEALKPTLEQKFREWQAHHVQTLCTALTNRHGLTKSQVAAVCRVTPSHLSHVLRGERASETLLCLLEAYVACPAEVERHMAGRIFQAYEAGPANLEGHTTGRTFRVEKFLRRGVTRQLDDEFLEQPEELSAAYELAS